jgi:hypothetical protein
VPNQANQLPRCLASFSPKKYFERLWLIANDGILSGQQQGCCLVTVTRQDHEVSLARKVSIVEPQG